MKTSRNLVKKIYPSSATNFVIEWMDGKSSEFTLSSLQKRCPCILCSDEKTGKRRDDAPFVEEAVRAYGIQSCGRYALKIDFISGCKKGIYTLDRLRLLADGGFDE
jgi:DUF971 family protein